MAPDELPTIGIGTSFNDTMTTENLPDIGTGTYDTDLDVCTDCDGQWTVPEHEYGCLNAVPLPPAGVVDRTPDELIAAAEVEEYFGSVVDDYAQLEE
jgi:hypothetical protein